jgi:hypothetical protein
MPSTRAAISHIRQSTSFDSSCSSTWCRKSPGFLSRAQALFEHDKPFWRG